jgi:hypothetical protein
MAGEWDVVSTRKAKEWDVVSTEPIQGQISAITGKEIPTGPEKIQASKTLIGEAAPYALDAVLAAAAPQLGIAKAAPTVLRIGGKLVNLGSRALAGGVGGMWGEAERQQMTGENAPDSIAMSGAVGAGSELAAPVLGKALKWGGTALSEASIAGRAVKNWMKDNMIGKIEKFTKSIAPEIDPEQAVFAIGDAMTGKRKIAKEAYNEYKPALEYVAKNPDYGDGKRIYMNDLRQYLDGIKKDIASVKIDTTKPEIERISETALNQETVKYFGFDPENGIGKSLMSLMENGGVSPFDVPDLHKVYGAKNKFGKLTGSERKSREELKDVILNDLDKIGIGLNGEKDKTIGGIIRAADENYKATAEYFENHPIANKLIAQYRKDVAGRPVYEAAPEYAIKQIFDGLDSIGLQNFKTNILKLKDGEKLWAGLEYGWVQDMFKKAIKESDQLGDKRLMPWELLKYVDDNKGKLEILSPGISKRLDEEIKMLRQVSTGLREAQPGKGAMTTLSMLGTGGMVANSLRGDTSNPENYVYPGLYEAMGALSALSVLSPKAQRFIGTIGKQGLKLGGHEAVKP